MSAPIEIRLLDVEALTVVSRTTDAEYVALSYVIGPKPHQSRCTCEVPCTQLEHFPRTISDAIRFVRNIGKGFLWVDYLCITAKGDQLRDELSKMAQIYAKASFTLACLGPNNETPLPGVSVARRVPSGINVRGGRFEIHGGAIGHVISRGPHPKRG